MSSVQELGKPDLDMSEGETVPASQEDQDSPHAQLKKFLGYVRSHLGTSPTAITQFAHLKISELTEVTHPDFSGTSTPPQGDSNSQGQEHSKEEHRETSEGAAPKGKTVDEDGSQSSKVEGETHSNDDAKDTSEDAAAKDESGDMPEERPSPFQLKWQRKDPEADSRPYRPPTEAFGEEVVQVNIDKMSDKKREIYVLSDVHLGRPLAICPGHLQLESTLSGIMEVVTEGRVHSVILLGDIFEMWIQLAAEPAWTEQEFLQHWKTDSLCKVFTQVVCNMVEEHGVDVYYVRGNHDHEITAAMIEELFCGKVRFVPGILFYTIGAGDREYRVRFEHGHIYDVMNTYSYRDPAGLVCGRPIGYFYCRCAAYRVLDGAMSWDGSGRTSLALKAKFAAMLKAAGPEVLKLICLPDVQQDLLAMIVESGLGGSIHGNAAIRMHDKTYVPAWKLLKCSFIPRLCEQDGLEKVFKMFLVWLDDFSGFLGDCDEDVVIVGHSHHWVAERATGRGGGPVLFANCGAWVDTEEVSYVRIVPPTNQEDGVVEVLHYPVTMATGQQ